MKKSSSSQLDALKFLKADHKNVSALFEKFEKGRLSKDAKLKLAAEICQALQIHAQIEEEIFYPAAREFLKKRNLSLIDEAAVEHESIKQLVRSIEAGKDSDLFDAQVHVLGEWVRHHVKEEEREIFPNIKNAKMDLKELGQQLADRKEELNTELNEHTSK